MMLITEHDSKVTPVSGRDTQAYAAGLFGEESASALTTTMDYTNAPAPCRG